MIPSACSALTGCIRSAAVSRAEGDVDGTLLDVEASFCYLGDMLSAADGCSLAIITRRCTAWGKFKKLLAILTYKHISLTVRRKVFDACVRSALLHGSESGSRPLQTCNGYTEMTDQWSDGSVVSSHMLKSPLICCVQGWEYRR